MGLVTIANIEANSPATANMFNERFGALADEINGNIEGVNIKDRSITAAKLATDVFQAMYPVGSLYFNANVDSNPASLLGFGTWERFAAGQMIVGVDSAQTEFDSLGKSGDTKTETLTVNQIPSHSHASNEDFYAFQNTGWGALEGAGANRWVGRNKANKLTSNTGGGAAHNNLPPYITVYTWRRIG